MSGKEQSLQLRRKHRVHYRDDEVEKSTRESKNRGFRSVISSGYGGRAAVDAKQSRPVFHQANNSSVRKFRHVSVNRSARTNLQRLRESSRSPLEHPSRRSNHVMLQKEAAKQSFVGRTLIRRPRHKIKRTMQLHPDSERSPIRKSENIGPASTSPLWALSSESGHVESPGANSFEVNLNSIGLEVKTMLSLSSRLCLLSVCLQFANLNRTGHLYSSHPKASITVSSFGTFTGGGHENNDGGPVKRPAEKSTGP
jgi:hypothetical protein